MRNAIAIVFILILLSAPVWAQSCDLPAPDGATPAQSPVVSQPAPAPPAADQPVPPAPRAVRTTTPPPTHPPVVDGHHQPSGHHKVYQEVKSWNPASCSRLDARDNREISERQKLGKEVRAELKSEAQTRASADETLSSRIKPLEEKGKDNWDLVTLTSILFILLITAVIGVKYSD